MLTISLNRDLKSNHNINNSEFMYFPFHNIFIIIIIITILPIPI